MSVLRDALGRGKRPAGASSDPPASPPEPVPAPPSAASPAPPSATLPTAPSAASPSAPSAASPSSPAAGDGRSDLRRRRDALAEQVTELHWDLGGLAYEMAIRDHFRLDVLVRRAAVLQQCDAELAEVERLLHSEESGSAGACPQCSAPHSRGAVYCWQCGGTLMERRVSRAAASPHEDGAATGNEDGPSTAVMDALLAPRGTSPPER